MASISLPSPNDPLVDKETGKITDVWYRYLFKNVSEVTTVELTATAPLSISTANVISVSTASQAAQEAGLSTSVVTPNVQQYHPSAAKAWGSVSLAGTVATVDAGYNVASAASTATGLLAVVLSVPFSSTTYVVVGNAMPSGSGFSRGVQISTIGLASSTFTLTYASTGGVGDPTAYYFACYGDQ